MPGSGGLFDGLSVREVRRRDLPSTGMDRRFDGLDTRIDDLNRHVHVLHEDVIARIEASSDRHAVTRGEFYAAFADLQESIGRRLDPLEGIVRQHSVDIERLKRRSR